MKTCKQCGKPLKLSDWEIKLGKKETKKQFCNKSCSSTYFANQQNSWKNKYRLEFQGKHGKKNN